MSKQNQLETKTAIKTNQIVMLISFIAVFGVGVALLFALFDFQAEEPVVKIIPAPTEPQPQEVSTVEGVPFSMHDVLPQSQFESEENYLYRAEHYQKYIAGDTSIHPRDFIGPSRWADPDTAPQSYVEYKANRAESLGEFQVTDIDNFGGPSVLKEGERGAGIVLVVVSDELYVEGENGIIDEIQQLGADLINEGYTARGYLTTNETADDLRALFQDYSGLVGVILVGDMPTQWFEYEGGQFSYEQFPTDLYYMDLDGIWTDEMNNYPYEGGILDTHSGDVEAEIWVGRIDATTLGEGNVSQYKNYFAKNHAYRTGALPLPTRALMYADDDWATYSGPRWRDDISVSYDDTTLINDLNGTHANGYESRLRWKYEWIKTAVHSTTTYHQFDSTVPGDNKVHSDEIDSIDPHGLFYNLFACSSGRFTASQYLAGRYLFTDTFGVAVIGSTKSGGMAYGDDIFHSTLNTGSDLGTAYKTWFNSEGVQSIGWNYGMTLLGDPTLTTERENDYPIAQIDEEDYIKPHGTISITGTALRSPQSGSVFNGYSLEIAPGINPGPDDWTPVTTVTNNGESEISNGELGVLDTRDYSDGYHVIRLTVDGGTRQTEYRQAIDIDNLQLEEPSHFVYRAGTPISIEGSVHYSGLYTVEYASDTDPDTWLSNGITLTGTAPQVDTVLANWDTSVINVNDFFTVRLSFEDGDVISTETFRVLLDPLYQEGFPQETLFRIVKPVAVGDIDGDSMQEIVAGDARYNTGFTKYGYAWNHDGSPVSGEWPVSLRASGLLAAPVLIDVDGDSDMEVFMSSRRNLYGFQGDGTPLSGWGDEKVSGEVRRLAAEDVNQDGEPELFSLDMSNAMSAFTLNGDPYGGSWPQSVSGPVYHYSQPALGDFFPSTPGLEIAGASQGTDVRVWSADGQALSPWPIESTAVNAHTMADLDQDGELELITTGASGIYVRNADTSLVWSDTDNGSRSLPAIGDIDNDGELELVSTSYMKLWVYEADGTSTLWDDDLVTGFNPYGLNDEDPPVLGDVDGDGDIEIVVVADGESMIWDRIFILHHDATLFEDWPRVVPSNYPTDGLSFWSNSTKDIPVITDLDNDGDVEIILGRHHHTFVWDLDGAYDVNNVPWGQYQGNVWHTGRVCEAAGSDFYVDPAFVPGMPCYGASKFNTIQEAVDAAADSGTTIHVAAGTYNENVFTNYKDIDFLGAGEDSTIIDGGGGDYGLYLSNGKGRVEGFTVQNADKGIYLFRFDHSVIVNNTVQSNELGMYVRDSNYNLVEDNVMQNNNQSVNSIGLYLDYAENNTIRNNTINNNEKGIQLYRHTYDNTVSGNTISGNDTIGVQIRWVQDNVVSGNDIYGNYTGIEFRDADYNSAIGNTVYDNTMTGITLTQSSHNNSVIGNEMYGNDHGYHISGASYNNTLYHNSSYDNIDDAYVETGSQTWDAGDTLGGNYWGDYQTRYPSAGNDGAVWDTPYEVGGYYDDYPLLSPWPENTCGGEVLLNRCNGSTYCGSDGQSVYACGLCGVTCPIGYNCESGECCKKVNGTRVCDGLQQNTPPIE